MTLALSASQWRLLNELGREAGGRRRFVQPLVDEQATDVADVRRLDEARLVRCFVGEQETTLAHHLDHDGSPMVVEVRLGERGRRYFESPTNKILRCFLHNPIRMAALSFVYETAGVDWSQVEPLLHRKLIRAHRSLTGERVESHLVPHLPAVNVRLALTGRGRMFLPVE